MVMVMMMVMMMVMVMVTVMRMKMRMRMVMKIPNGMGARASPKASLSTVSATTMMGRLSTCARARTWTSSRDSYRGSSSSSTLTVESRERLLLPDECSGGRGSAEARRSTELHSSSHSSSVSPRPDCEFWAAACHRHLGRNMKRLMIMVVILMMMMMIMKRMAILAPPVDGLDGPAVGEEGAERRAESQEAVVEAPHGQGGGVEQTVT